MKTEQIKRYIFSKSLAKIESPKVIETSQAYCDDMHPVGYSLFSISKEVKQALKETACFAVSLIGVVVLLASMNY